jgi:hypothetical protein
MTGLAAGTVYIDVVANNIVGPSTASSPRLNRTVLAASVPGQPSNVAGLTGNRQVELTWTAPANDGGSAISGYRIQMSLNGASFATVVPTTGSSLTAWKVTGLTNTSGSTPMSYRFRVAAINATGRGANSANSAGRSPNLFAPQAPSNVTVTKSSTALSGRLDVAWTLGSDRGTPILRSIVRAWSAATGGVVVGTCTALGTATTCTVTGLQKFHTYYVDVFTQNQQLAPPAFTGTSVASSPRIARLT